MIVLELFWSFLRMGLFNFGGGYAMVSLMRQEVLGHGWISAGEFADMVAVSQMTPGPLAVNLATYVGFKTAGFLGAAIATLGVFLPSLVICVIVAHLLRKFQENQVLGAVLGGIKPAVVALVCMAFVFMAGMSVFTQAIPLDFLLSKTGNPEAGSFGISWPSLAIFAGVLIAHGRFKLDPILLIVLSAAVGLLLF